ncbi:uncharacterized protein PHACADRAFT_202670 [Phanerochaete carnosa HHB-10118-sp]|uniref:Uncharacterized protein n=1 Tax=Phanerochaete carnosa (strain HHB-10118-sp) TaxID=650164 RepID=K5UGE8_PHACS|nr:uncharacterized protein PHACADRAFT_202670 [Phanerochaete carnosa HHB-10118-sp]EKM48556.1 hypothetical protein PHACADRAFT_202670 [Phanerochaete carnosa HHB-10118-sp]
MLKAVSLQFTTAITTLLQPIRVSEKGVPTELCVYSPKDNVVLPDNTVVFAYTRVYISVKGPALLNAIQIYPFPSDPSDNDYDGNLPEILPCLFATGIVRSVHDVTAIDNNKRVMLEVSDCMQDGKKGFTFEAKFTGATPWWNRVPLPSLQSNAQICAHLRCWTSPVTPPAKKRKYNAYIASGTFLLSSTASTSSLAGPSGSSQSTLPEPGSAAGEVSPAEQQEPVAMLSSGSMEDTTAFSAKAAGKRKARQ